MTTTDEQTLGPSKEPWPTVKERTMACTAVDGIVIGTIEKSLISEISHLPSPRFDVERPIVRTKA